MNNTGFPSIDKTHERDLSFLEKHPIIPNVSIYNTIKLISNFYKNEKAVNSLNLSVTYDEMIKDSVMISKALKEIGIKSKDIITVSMPNFYQAVAIFLAANRIGATVTFLNYYSTVEEIKHYLNQFESPLYINYGATKAENELIKKDTKVRNIITLSKYELNNCQKNNSKYVVGYSDYLCYSDLKNVSSFYKGIFSNNLCINNDALILFTSGTTGNPKSVVLTNENILASGIYMKNSIHVKNKSGEKCLVCVPFCYPYGFVTSTLMTLLCGREAILAPNLSKDNISYYLSKNPNIVFGSPALLELIKRNTLDNQDLSSINTFVSGGDFLTPSQSNEGKKFFESHNANVEICNGSGNAETTATSTTAVGIPNKIETVGRILSGSEAIIINPETNEEMKYGEEGILCIRGKHIFKEYFGEEELTKDSFVTVNKKRYFNTGSRGMLDTDGYFTLTGRASRFYIMSTLNKIYCDHVQSIMSNIDCIESCAIVKMPHKDLLYVNKAFIVLKEGVKPDDETIDYIKSKCLDTIVMPNGEETQLKPYEIPFSIEFVDELPRNSKSDKIDYLVLEENAIDEFNNSSFQKVKK